MLLLCAGSGLELDSVWSNESEASDALETHQISHTLKSALSESHYVKALLFLTVSFTFM